MRKVLLACVLAFAGLVSAPAGASALVLVDQVPSGSNSVPTVPSFDYPVAAGDSVAADDFKVPSGQTWVPTAVDVFGKATGGSSGTDTANVTIYRDGSGSVPGDVVFTATGLALNGGTCTVGQTCSPSIPLSGVPSLGPGNYWVSVQFAGTYAWYWAVRPVGDIFGAAAVWQNPGNGFNRGCTTWTPIAQCNWTTASDGTDMIYRLEGSLTDSNFSVGGFTGHTLGSLKLGGTFPGPGVAVIQDASTVKKGKAAKPKKPKALIKKVRLNVGRGDRKLPIKLTQAAKDKLARKGKVTLRVAVTYTPQGGVAQVKRTKLTLNAR